MVRMVEEILPHSPGLTISRMERANGMVVIGGGSVGTEAFVIMLSPSLGSQRGKAFRFPGKHMDICE